ncbi:thiamine-phosphate kinase [Anaerosinus gibii]|uniref:Thiamine-monophosphate kinase n=1 Tax=Selenobaculum gibii TaxID=3054208 RepID=A0A9Y2AJT7_9FIRM|nr:thiamine-phosphate kinase [Selenobaculum gbiensis]WIW71504.1 thiamine-phosphate kinase [Selenobaculum gbiensis]
MDIKECGEFGLIDLIKENCIVEPKSVAVGIGDDAAVLIPTHNMLQLVSADMLVEGVHFDLSFISPFQLGYKSLAVNLSDIAAMGGIPKHVVLSIALPKKINVDFVKELYRGMKNIAQSFCVNIVGGDTVSTHDKIVINVTVLGEVEPEKLQKRNGAKPGDFIVVTGTLGDSAAGLDILLNKKDNFDFAEPLIKAHLMPFPQVELGRIIAKYASSMNDISDGLASEAKEIALASSVDVMLDAGKVPFSTELLQRANFFRKTPLEYALFGGEDYQLLFTISKEKYILLQKELSNCNIKVVGEVKQGTGNVFLKEYNGKFVNLEPKGYNHFR